MVLGYTTNEGAREQMVLPLAQGYEFYLFAQHIITNHTRYSDCRMPPSHGCVWRIPYEVRLL